MPSFGCLVASMLLPSVAMEFHSDRYSSAGRLTLKCSRIFSQETRASFFP